MSIHETEDGAYSQQEKNDLEKLKSIRMDAIETMIKDGIPIKVSEIRVLNELITAGEKSIHDTVANQLKYKDNDNKDNLNKLVAEVLLRTKTNTESIGTRRDEPVLAEDIVTDGILEGELKQGIQDLDTNEFIGSNDDN